MHAEMVSRIHLFICLPLQGSLGHLGHSTIHFSLPPFKAVQDYDSYSVCINYFKILWLQYAAECILNHLSRVDYIWYDYDYNTIQWSYLIILLFSKASTLIHTLASHISSSIMDWVKVWQLHPSLSLQSISGPKLEIIINLRSFWSHWLADWTLP